MSMFPTTRKVLATTLAALMLSTTMASAVDIVRSGVWTSYMASNKDKGPICGMRVENANNSQAIHIKWFQNQRKIYIQAFKTTWKIPNDTDVHVEVGFDDDLFGDTTAVGYRDKKFSYVEFHIDDAEITKAFMGQFQEANKMWLKFPDGNEEPWVADMKGSREISVSFMNCIAGLAKRDTQPYGKQPDTSSTQPFGKSPAAQPSKRLPQTSDERGA